MRMYLQNTVSLERTFAGRHALKPLVINVSVAGTSTVIIPSTARSAATDPAGFLERTTFEAHLRFRDRGGDGWHAD